MKMGRIEPMFCCHIADSTWQKWGHSSKIGVVFVISVRTGEVLDYIVKTLVCHTPVRIIKIYIKQKHMFSGQRNIVLFVM